MLKKIFFLICVFSLNVSILLAGDVANFVNLGFSDNGKFFAFGEYGMQDKTYRSYAKIYIVDVAKNAFVSSGVFKTSPSAITANKESKSVFLGLENRATNALVQSGIKSQNEGRPIYAQTEKTKNNTNFEFRDFETNHTYNVILHKKTKNLSAAFYITFNVISPDGSKASYEVGNKDYFRSGVKDYSIKKVLINSANDALVFIVEKVISDPSGDCIRYMVETIKL